MINRFHHISKRPSVKQWPFSIAPTRVFVTVALALLCFACSKQEIKEPEEYKGPLREVQKLESYYTENDIVKTKVMADVVYELKNGDREFPKGIYMENYDITGKLESTLKANYAFFVKEKNIWQGRGKVEVKNVIKNEQLNTEELFWKQTEKKIYTEKFVTIRQQGDVIYGTGLDAKQDLSDYVIQHPEGELDVVDEEE